jgi:dTDP-4-dehydrorhamnose reductase
MIEIWGGVECTVNRVGNTYFDQLARNGHDRRISDLELFAELGIKTLRSPFLWEKIAPNGDSNARWDWAKVRLARMGELKIRPIVGLLHHGSGPPTTSLLDPEFGQKFAAYALAFARRFPEVVDYTPINEPLTTARFSALYGFWYPHARDSLSFLQALINECRGIVLAMNAIRSVNSKARLIQTEDMGRVSSTPRLAYQRNFENERRWLSFDLLCGKVMPGHMLWDYILSTGVSPKDLLWFVDHACPPSVVGLNHYVVSNRFLDERLNRYPHHLHGGNGKDRYADTEAVRCEEGPGASLQEVLSEAWSRYQIPLAITECHIDGTREEQARWLLDIWKQAQAAHMSGACVRALTVWSLLGHYDWHCLLTRCENIYHSGVYDLRSGVPRPTTLAHVVKSLIQEGNFEHPTLEVPGWWRRTTRIFYPNRIRPSEPGAPDSFGQSTSFTGKIRPLLITGGRGTLGQAFSRICEVRAIPYRVLSRPELDIADLDSVQRAVEAHDPWGVINAAGYVRVDDAESERERCFRENIWGAANLARICHDRNISYLSFSSDLVFDGDSQVPYQESSPVSPLNTYGTSKAEAEKKVLQIYPSALIVRTSAFFGPWDEANFLHQLLERLSRGEKVRVPADIRVSPTYVPDLVNTCLDMLLDRERGIWHLANVGDVSWDEFGRIGAEHAGLDSSGILATPASQLHFRAPRPLYSVLGSERGTLLPPLGQAIERYFKESA